MSEFFLYLNDVVIQITEVPTSCLCDGKKVCFHYFVASLIQVYFQNSLSCLLFIRNQNILPPEQEGSTE